jgi:hypothetical protein
MADAKETAEQARARIAKEVAKDVPADQPESVELTNCINRANTLIEQKAEVLAGLQQCRELATLLTQTGSGSREQVAWVREYLPRKSRSKDENGAE